MSTRKKFFLAVTLAYIAFLIFPLFTTFSGLSISIVSIIAVAILIMASVISGRSQTRSVEHDFSPFDAIEASDGFKVSTSQSDSYSVKLTVDDALESYVECYVKAGTLHIGLDEKNVPRDLKKQYKGKNSGDPTLVAIVYMPSLKKLILNDNSEFFNSSNLSGESFTLALNGTSKIADLKVVAKTIDIALTKNAKLTNANLSAEGDATINMDSKTTATLSCAAENLILTTAGSSDLTLSANIEKKAVLYVSGTAKLTMSGSANALEVNGKATSAKIDAHALQAETANLVVSGTSMSVAVAQAIEFDLGKGTEVTYSGDPTVKIVKIQNASVLRE